MNVRQRSAHRLPWLEPGRVMRPKFTHKNPAQSGLGETLIEPIWDYSATAINTATVLQTLLSIPIGSSYTPTGGTAFLKTRYHTNLKNAGQLPAPDLFVLQGLSVTLDPRTTPSDMAKFTFQMLLTLTIGDKDIRYIELQPILVPGAGGVYIAGTPANSAYATANGWPNSANFYRLGETEEEGAQVIALAEPFSLTEDPTKSDQGAFTSDAATASPASTVGLRVLYHLWGVRTRSA